MHVQSCSKLEVSKLVGHDTPGEPETGHSPLRTAIPKLLQGSWEAGKCLRWQEGGKLWHRNYCRAYAARRRVSYLEGSAGLLQGLGSLQPPLISVLL